jgi:hypothetical protein
MAGEAQGAGGGQLAEAAAPAPAGAPLWLRPARFACGVVLLALAWGATMAAIVLVAVTIGLPPRRYELAHAALYALGAIGALWLGALALACVIVGAFCITLALTERGW